MKKRNIKNLKVVYSKEIPIKPNTDYIISSNKSVTSGGQLTFRFYDEDLNYIPVYTGLVTQTTVNGKGYAKATSFSNAKYTRG